MFFQFTTLNQYYRRKHKRKTFYTNTFIVYEDNFSYLQKVFYSHRLNGKPVTTLYISDFLYKFKNQYLGIKLWY